jgi:hypothetical protein
MSEILYVALGARSESEHATPTTPYYGDVWATSPNEALAKARAEFGEKVTQVQEKIPAGKLQGQITR